MLKMKNYNKVTCKTKFKVNFKAKLGQQEQIHNGLSWLLHQQKQEQQHEQ